MPRPTLVAGSQLGARFRILRAIGSGGFGAVYEAERVDVPIRVALKVLHTAVALDEVERQRFRREASVMTDLRHPHIVEVVETGETGEGAPFLALELLHGHSLGDELRGAGPRPAEWVAGVARQVLQALEVAHGRGVVHRDLKPHNLFLCADQPTAPFVKVLDFGIAKLVGAGAAAHTLLTATGAVLGTPHYMAPEQVYGEEIGPGVDLYALGLVMAEALAGRRVVQGSDPLEILMVQASDVPISLPPEVTGSPLGWIVERAVHKSLAHRYGSASAMIADLDRAFSPAVTPHSTAAPHSTAMGTTTTATTRTAPDRAIPTVATAPQQHVVVPQSRGLAPLLIGALAFVLILFGGAAAVGWWLWTDDGRGSPSSGRGGVRWRGSFEQLSPSTVSRVLESRGYVVGDVISKKFGGGDLLTVSYSVPVKQADDSCSVSLVLYNQRAAADVTDRNMGTSPMPQRAYLREGNAFLIGWCENGKGRPLLDAMLQARD